MRKPKWLPIRNAAYSAMRKYVHICMPQIDLCVKFELSVTNIVGATDIKWKIYKYACQIKNAGESAIMTPVT